MRNFESAAQNVPLQALRRRVGPIVQKSALRYVLARVRRVEDGELLDAGLAHDQRWAGHDCGGHALTPSSRASSSMGARVTQARLRLGAIVHLLLRVQPESKFTCDCAVHPGVAAVPTTSDNVRASSLSPLGRTSRMMSSSPAVQPGSDHFGASENFAKLRLEGAAHFLCAPPLPAADVALAHTHTRRQEMAATGGKPPVFAFRRVSAFPALTVAAETTRSADLFGAGRPVVVHFYNSG